MSAMLPFAVQFGSTDIDPIRMALLIGFVVISLGIHEWAHAYVAHLLGDDTAKDLGRMTPNPLPHIDLVWSIVVPIVCMLVFGFPFGAAKPVPVDPRNFKNPNGANAVVAAAGPLSNIVLAVVAVLAYQLVIEYGGYKQDQLLPIVVGTTAVLNVALAVFNMIPFPPFDGSRIVYWALPIQLRPGYAAIERYGLLLIFGILWLSGPIARALGMTDPRVMLSTTVFELAEWINALVDHLGRSTGLW